MFFSQLYFSSCFYYEMKYIKIKIPLHDRNMTIVFQFVTTVVNREILFMFTHRLPNTVCIWLFALPAIYLSCTKCFLHHRSSRKKGAITWESIKKICTNQVRTTFLLASTRKSAQEGAKLPAAKRSISLKGIDFRLPTKPETNGSKKTDCSLITDHLKPAFPEIYNEDFVET